jgi:ABC-type glycerol-3-phosphate transport system substrate-binding protein
MKVHPAISLFTGLAVLLAACSTPPTPEAAAPQPTAAVESPVATATAAQETTAAVELAFWYPYGEGSDAGDFLADQIQAFNQANPGIVVSGQSYEDYASIIEGIQRGAAGQDLPSIAAIGFGYDDYIIDSGLAQPIEDYMGAGAGEFFGDIYPTLLDVTTHDGKVYGVPLALSVAEVFYHPDLFEQAGLDPDNPPQTWDEFVQAAQTIHDETGVYGAAFALDDPWIFETAVRSNGAELLSADGQTANLNSATAIKVLQDWGDGAQNGAFLYNADFMQTLQSFGSQQIAMFAVSSYGTGYYHANLPEVKAMAFPAGEGYTFQSPAGGNSLYILGNDDAERQAAAQFIAFLTSPEVNAAWAQTSGYLPVRASSLDAMQDYITGFENYELAVGLIQNVVPPTLWPSRHVLQVKQILLGTIESTMLGQQSAADALQAANDQVNALLAQ